MHEAETVRAAWELGVTVSPQMDAAQVLDDAGQLLDPEVAAELKDLREENPALRARIAELEAERHTTNEALSDAAEQLRVDRDRITELEQLLAAKDRPVDEDPIAYALTEKAELADKLTHTFASLREDVYESPLRHDYRVGHDLPKTGGGSC